jgi:hypothetical protein
MPQRWRLERAFGAKRCLSFCLKAIRAIRVIRGFRARIFHFSETLSIFFFCKGRTQKKENL